MPPEGIESGALPEPCDGEQQVERVKKWIELWRLGLVEWRWVVGSESGSADRQQHGQPESRALRTVPVSHDAVLQVAPDLRRCGERASAPALLGQQDRAGITVVSHPAVNSRQLLVGLRLVAAGVPGNPGEAGGCGQGRRRSRIGESVQPDRGWPPARIVVQYLD